MSNFVAATSKKSKWAEGVAAALYAKQYSQVAPPRNFPDWDVSLPELRTLEVKLDGRAGESKQFFVEYETSTDNKKTWRPSGLCNSKADMLAICLLINKPFNVPNTTEDYDLQVVFAKRTDVLQLAHEKGIRRETWAGKNNNKEGMFTAGLIINLSDILNLPEATSVTVAKENLPILKSIFA